MYYDNPTTETIVCPVCSISPGKYSLDIGSFQISKCQNCGLEFTSPNPTNDELFKFYSDYNDIRAHNEIVRINAGRNLELLRSFGFNNESRLLDYGCGNGDFVEIAGSNACGIEFTEDKFKRIFRAIESTPYDQYDFITLWGVLEHLNDPVSTIRELTKHLHSGSIIALTTVDAESHIPYYYKPPEHLTYWTRKSLYQLLESNNFVVDFYNTYEMRQLSEIYLDRLLSRTPNEYKEIIATSVLQLPRIITIPTNEVIVVGHFK